MTARGIACGAVGLALALATARGGVWEVTAPTTCGETTLCRGATEAVAVEERPGGGAVRVEGAARAARPGEPDLPRMVRLIPLPSGCRGAVVIERVDAVETNGVDVAPVAASAGVRPERGPVYDSDAWWPAMPVQVDVADRGSERWARVVYHPVQWNPVSRTLRWNRSVEARLVWRAEGGVEAGGSP